MGEMADLLMEQQWDEWAEGGEESFEDILADTPPHVWVSNSGEHYLISKMERRHVWNTIRMLGRWVRDGRGSSEAEIVGAKRWANLLKRSREA